MISRSKAKEILADCEAALAPVAEKHGLTLKRKSCRFKDTEMPVAFKLEAPVTRNGSELNQEEANYTDNAERWGISHINLGDEIMVGRATYTIIGAKPRARKYPIIGKRSDGKRFKFSLQTARFGWRCAQGDL